MSTAYQRAPDELVSGSMTKKLLTCSPDTTLVEAAHRMADRRVGAILVTENDGLVGILTERDVLKAVGNDSINCSVADCMTHDPITVGLDASNGEAASLMIHGGFRHVPVVDGEQLVGIVSIRDLLRLPNESPSGV
ncbi:MAG: cyclic nucleotide-binding/CBS domain-containing protein [Gaiellales bacterium]|jgi:CBS domain-containing protein|nr:CBS domain-containing protein [Gaiellales bacterium]